MNWRFKEVNEETRLRWIGDLKIIIEGNILGILLEWNANIAEKRENLAVRYEEKHV